MARQPNFNTAIKPILKSHQQTTSLLNKLGKQGWTMGGGTTAAASNRNQTRRSGTTGRGKGQRQNQNYAT